MSWLEFKIYSKNTDTFPHTFVYFATQWINLELLTRVKFAEIPGNGNAMAAEITFVDNVHHTTLDEANIQTLRKYLENNRAA